MTTPSLSMVKMCVTEFCAPRRVQFVAIVTKSMTSTVRQTCALLFLRPVRGVSASMSVIDEKKNNLKVDKIDGFSKFHNLFECPEPGRQKVFKSFCELEIHAEIGNHGNRPMFESFCDQTRREWAKCFSTIDPVQADGSTSGSGIRSSEETTGTPPSDLSQGWALSKPRVSTRFSQKVKACLDAKFELGERTSLKADPNQVSADMRNA